MMDEPKGPLPARANTNVVELLTALRSYFRDGEGAFLKVGCSRGSVPGGRLSQPV